MKRNNIELRSEEVQDIMGQIPSWIVRYGITILFIVVFALIVGSYFFKYPDVIQAEMTLTSHHPVAQVVARTSGKISQLNVSDGEKVKSGEILAVIQNPAVEKDVNYLKKLLDCYQGTPDSLAYWLLSGKELVLGEIQSDYVGLLSSLYDYSSFRKLDYYPQKMTSVKNQIAKYQVYFQNQQRQRKVVADQYHIVLKQYERDSMLLMKNVISQFDYETAQKALLQGKYSLEQAEATLDNLKIQIGNLEESLLDLQLQNAEKEGELIHNYRTALKDMMNGLNGWVLNYCLLSPIEGTVTFTNYWNENQFVTSGDPVFSIVPKSKEELVGRAMLPVERSGKVKTGQRVIVRLANYPDQEFGIVNGTLSSVSLVPMENNYMVEITFPDGLISNYGKKLPVSHEMKATAEIVTEDLRLIERLFFPLKKIMKEAF